MTTATPNRATGAAAKSPFVVILLCWIAVLLDGFDLVVLGATLPSMLEDPAWDLTGAQATQITTIGLVGMAIGALVIGFLTDKLGRRWVLIVSVFFFSLFTLFLAFTTNVFWFSTWRFLAGAGLGGALPTAIAMVTEFRTGRKAGSAATTLMTGYHVGAVLTALLAMVIIADFGWHSMFLAGAIPGFILVPFLFFLLPESPAFLRTRGRDAEATAVEQRYGIVPDTEMDKLQEQKEGSDAPVGIKTLFQPTFRLNTIAIWGTSFMGLLLVYGLNTWLPQIMRAADYDMGNSLAFLMVLNIGAVVGLFIAGRVADIRSPRTTALIWFTCSAVALAMLALRLPLVGLYFLVFITGVFVFSSQVLIYAFVGENHPSSVRATALGFSASIGRLGAISGPLLGGIMVTAGIAYPWGFFAFAIVGLLGALIFSTSRTLRPSTLKATEQSVVSDSATP